MTTLAIWDVDGTLTESKQGIFESYRYAARMSGLPEPSAEILETMCCGELYGHIYQLFHATGEEADILAKDYRWHYSEICSKKVRLFDGITDVLEEMERRGIVQAVATMNNEEGAKTLLERLGIAHHFRRIAGADLEGKITKADMIRDCMSTGSYDRVVMIGDCPGDRKAAEIAGAEFLAAAFGYGYNIGYCKEHGIDYAVEPKDVLNYF